MLNGKPPKGMVSNDKWKTAKSAKSKDTNITKDFLWVMQMYMCPFPVLY